MKFLIGIVLIILVGTLAHWMMPWWIIAIIAGLISAILGMRSFVSFCYGFLAVALLWGVYAFILNSSNGGLLLEKIAELFQLNGVLLILLVALIGGLLGGMGALTGSLCRQLFDGKSV